MLKMTYKIENGMKVCQNREVVISHVRHRVVNGFVKCDKSLNRDSWNVTNETRFCPKCYPPPVELELDF